MTAQVAPADDLSAVWAKTLAASETQVSAPIGKNDKMPKNPGDDAPLTDRPFPDLGPVRAALEERAGSRKQHPGMAHEAAELASYNEAPTAAAEILGAAALRKSNEPPQPAVSPVFDPASLDLPPRPQSAFDAAAPVPAPRPDEDFSPAPTATRNTFIEAARRNAQRQTVAKKDANPHSLIGRAMARFQTAQEAKAASAPFAEAPPMTLAEKAGKKAKAKPAKQAAEMPVAVEDDTTIVPLEQDSINVDARPVDIDLPPQESFLTRHRRPILLGATLVAVSVLTLNLVNQRLAEAGAGQKNSGTATAAVPASPAAALTPEPKSAVGPTSLTTSPDLPAAKVGALPAAPRVIPMVDSLTTGSIDPSAAMNFSKPAEISMMPSILSPTSLTAQDLSGPTAAKPEPAPPAVASPVHVDLPPVNVGPLALRQAAANGDPRAQFEVAAIFTEGRAVPEDLKQAAAWYERAAAQGFAPAQYRLGNLYESGKGVEKDLQQARLWYQRAAEAGNRMSMHNLAALYAGGQLGKQDFPPAAEWFEQAAMRGMTDSQFNLGMLYARGLGVTQNLATSYKWFSLAARSGDKDAAKARDDVARSLDAAAVSKVNEELAAWKPVSIALVANFAPIGTWQKDFDPGQPITEKAVVSKVQEALQRLGYDVGTADGVAGVKTIDAIRSFEQATGMSQIGKINPRLLAVLGSQPV
jgi:localization factor PodJL